MSGISLKLWMSPVFTWKSGGRHELRKVSRKSHNQGWECFLEGSLRAALGPQPVSNLDPTYHTPPKTKHTCELLAEEQVQAGERHVLEHLDVAWGNGVGRGRVRRNGEGSQESSCEATRCSLWSLEEEGGVCVKTEV